MDKDVKVRAFTATYSGFSHQLINQVEIRGPVIEGRLTPSSLPVAALWDTGATGSVINQDIVDRLGLEPIGVKQVHTANGTADQHTYLVSIYLPSGIIVQTVATCAGLSSPSFSCLIGMDIIGKGDFAVSNFNGITAFTYRYPSLEKIDFSQPSTKGHAEALSRNQRREQDKAKKKNRRN